jgi:hypothetical protein
MEPITAITLPKWMTDRLKARDRIKVPYAPRISLASKFIGDGAPAGPVPQTYAEIWFEEFHRKGERHWFCFTRDGEHALCLKSVFLAGQAQAVIDRERDAFNAGVLTALERVFGFLRRWASYR